MASLAELARQRTDLTPPQVAHLQRLVASWGLLADFCFADLLLFAPDRRRAGRRALRRARPGPADHQPDRLPRPTGSAPIVDEEERPLVARAFRLGEIIEGEATIAAAQGAGAGAVHPGALPAARSIGVLTRESAPSFGRQPGELERTYVDIFNRFARMIARRRLPVRRRGHRDRGGAPRRRRRDPPRRRRRGWSTRRPTACRPCTASGVHANAEGLRLRRARPRRRRRCAPRSPIGAPVTEEVERGPEVTVLIRCIPLLDHGAVTGAVVLLRDISELRRRDRLLLSKDATIREIHHRVKNNLQTISSLLRLQGRRLASPEAKVAIEESVRRIRSIALVHETCRGRRARTSPFVEIVRPLVRMVEEGMSSARPAGARSRSRATPGMLPADGGHAAGGRAQRAAPERDRPRLPGRHRPAGGARRVIVRLDERRRASCGSTVVDDGVGLPDGLHARRRRPASGCRSCGRW